MFPTTEDPKMKKLSAKSARVREFYAARTGMNTRACKILIAAHQVKIGFVEDEDGIQSPTRRHVP